MPERNLSDRVSLENLSNELELLKPDNSFALDLRNLVSRCRQILVLLTEALPKNTRASVRQLAETRLLLTQPFREFVARPSMFGEALNSLVCALGADQRH